MRDELLHDLGTVVEFGQLIRQFAGIEGWLSEEEGYLLYRLARDGAGHGEIVEIGSWKGRSTAWLAAGSKAAGREHVHAVDTFAGSPEHRNLEVIRTEGTTYHRFAENLERVGLFDHVEPVIATSSAAAQRWDGRPVRLLFIDGDHDYESVRQDFELWSRHLGVGGVLAFDDVIDKWPGVKRCVEEVLAQQDTWGRYCAVHKMCVLRRLK